jgi:hypothetical protein
VWDRDELKGAVQDIIARRGEFFCLLGGKSTGKSLVIQHLEKLCLEGCNIGIVFVVNQRIEGSNILKGLMTFPGTYLRLQKELDVAVQIGRHAATVFAKEEEHDALSKFIMALIDNTKMEQPLQVLIEELLKRVEGSLTLIIDEANIAFTITENTNEEKVEALVGILATFTQLKKQSRKV